MTSTETTTSRGTCPICEKRTPRYVDDLGTHVHAKCEDAHREQLAAETEAPTRKSPTRYETLAQVIDRGGIDVGTKVVATYKGKKLTATILEDGKVRHAKKEWGSLSYAAKAACEGAGGKYHQTGWTFWKLADGRPVHEVRNAV